MIFNDYYNKSFLDHKSWLVSIRKKLLKLLLQKKKVESSAVSKKPWVGEEEERGETERCLQSPYSSHGRQWDSMLNEKQGLLVCWQLKRTSALLETSRAHNNKAYWKIESGNYLLSNLLNTTSPKGQICAIVMTLSIWHTNSN